MIDMSDEALGVVQGSYVQHVRAQSWLGDQLLAENIPISVSSEEVDSSLAVPERVTLTVPAFDNGVEWAPIRMDHPLQAYGQRLFIEVGIELGGGIIEWSPRGWFVITDSDVDNDAVDVQCGGLLTYINEARFVSPFQPTGTFESTVRELIEPALTAEFTDLTDRAIPGSMSWDEDRRQALGEVLDAWPADAQVDENGVLQVHPLVDAAPVLSLTDGAGGTVIHAHGGTTRSGAATAVVARGQKADGTHLQGVAYDTAARSPLRYGGPFNPLPVPYFYFSPLLDTVTQCQLAAQTILARLRRNAAHNFYAELVPHPGLRSGDVVAVTSEELDLDAVSCVIDSYKYPHTAGQGPMTLGLRVLH